VRAESHGPVFGMSPERGELEKLLAPYLQAVEGGVAAATRR